MSSLSRQALTTWRGFAACRLGPVRCYLRPDICRCVVLKLHRDTVCRRHSGRPIETHSDHSGYKRAVTVKNALQQGAGRIGRYAVTNPVCELVRDYGADPGGRVTSQCGKNVEVLWLSSAGYD